ncbi:hypothetical protein SAMN02910409_1105 [Prevotellaceae bacterium HUN156]|nr:hypothetical protein SAMN02910409_1105 [Prevotellaceae bacterium HUN156]
MVYVWYMFSKHIPCQKLFVDRHSSYAMVEGYMFLCINYFYKRIKKKRASRKTCTPSYVESKSDLT